MPRVSVNPSALLALGAPLGAAYELAPILSQYLELWGIDTPIRVKHFLAQAAHETARFSALREGGVSEASYGGYPGRGLMHLTGERNYAAYQADLNSRYGQGAPNVLANPALLETYQWAVDSGVWFWRANNLNRYADRGASTAAQLALSKAINCGSQTCRTPSGLPNGWADRQALFAIADRAVDSGVTFSSGSPYLMPAPPGDPFGGLFSTLFGGTFGGGGYTGGHGGGWPPTYGEPVEPGGAPVVCLGLDCPLPGGGVYVSPGVSRYAGQIRDEATALLRGEIGLGQLSPLTVVGVAALGGLAVVLASSFRD